MVASQLVGLAVAAVALIAMSSGVSAADSQAVASETTWDPKGYLYFCPCMGRFGNQVEYYLGVLALAKMLDRTLILPPFIEYTRQGGRRFPRFSHFFQVSAVRKYHRVIEAHRFIEIFGADGQPWAAKNRIAYCWGNGQPPVTCNMKNGQPSTDFWEHQGLGSWAGYEHHMLNSRFGSPGSDPPLERLWRNSFPVSKHPVVVFSGAPAPLPMERENYNLQQYLVWAKPLAKRARKFIASELTPAGKWISAHLRVGSDWKSACGNAVGSPQWMSSPQCLAPNEKVTKEICYQDGKQIAYAIKRRVEATGAKAVFVATDADDHIGLMKAALPDVKFVRYRDPKTGDDDPALDLIILGESEHFIGNCISSFTAFVKRQRDLQGRASTWFGYGEEVISDEQAARTGGGKKTKPKSEL